MVLSRASGLDSLLESPGAATHLLYGPGLVTSMCQASVSQCKMGLVIVLPPTHQVLSTLPGTFETLSKTVAIRTLLAFLSVSLVSSH